MTGPLLVTGNRFPTALERAQHARGLLTKAEQFARRAMLCDGEDGEPENLADLRTMAREARRLARDVAAGVAWRTGPSNEAAPAPAAVALSVPD